MSHLKDVKKSEQRRVETTKTKKQATQKERASISIKVLYSNDGH